jgi:hypothetical protein
MTTQPTWKQPHASIAAARARRNCHQVVRPRCGTGGIRSRSRIRRTAEHRPGCPGRAAHPGPLTAPPRFSRAICSISAAMTASTARPAQSSPVQSSHGFGFCHRSTATSPAARHPPAPQSASSATQPARRRNTRKVIQNRHFTHSGKCYGFDCSLRCYSNGNCNQTIGSKRKRGIRDSRSGRYPAMKACSGSQPRVLNKPPDRSSVPSRASDSARYTPPTTSKSAGHPPLRRFGTPHELHPPRSSRRTPGQRQ